jgi:hypothetical protein
MPGSRLVVFGGAGHFPHHHHPDRFVTEIREFVAKTEPARFDPQAWRALLRAGPAGSPGSHAAALAAPAAKPSGV